MADDTNVTSADILKLDPKFIYEVALGVESGETIARRWGIRHERWEKIRETKAFKLQVAALKADMERTGVTFGTTAGVMAKELLDIIFKEAISGETDIKNRLEVLRSLAKYANFEPKSSSDAPTAPRFSINISLPEGVKINEIVDDSTRKMPENDVVDAEKAVLKLDFGGKSDVS